MATKKKKDELLSQTIAISKEIVFNQIENAMIFLEKLGEEEDTNEGKTYVRIVEGNWLRYYVHPEKKEESLLAAKAVVQADEFVQILSGFHGSEVSINSSMSKIGGVTYHKTSINGGDYILSPSAWLSKFMATINFFEKKNCQKLDNES